MKDANATSPDRLWVQFALEQAKIVAQHLETGACDPDFVRLHALTLLQVVDHACVQAEGDSVHDPKKGRTLFAA